MIIYYLQIIYRHIIHMLGISIIQSHHNYKIYLKIDRSIIKVV